jgi:hypothetical protein
MKRRLLAPRTLLSLQADFEAICRDYGGRRRTRRVCCGRFTHRKD